MTIKENLSVLKISLPSQVTLVVVSKTQSTENIMQVYEAGHRDFGENYVQELVDKQAQLPKDIRWHFIGHLQSNKVKYIAPFVHLIHGVDSIKLLREIDKQASKNRRVIDCLLQIFIATEETKFGFSYEECENILGSEELATLKNIRIKGFMAMASNTSNENQIKREFGGLKLYFDKVNKGALSLLSFGMSADYKFALEQGSNMIRVGSAIFGAREKF